MFLLRRAAFRAVSAKPSTPLLSQSRSIITAARPTLSSRQQWTVPSFQKRFNSDEVKKTEEATKSEEVVAAEASSETPAEAPVEVETATDATSEVVGKPSATESSSASYSTPASGSTRAFGSEENTPNPTLYVGNLFFEVSEEALGNLFREHGAIKKTRIVYDHRGLSKGFGYVEFDSVESATKAIESLNQQPFQGRRLAVQFHRRREPLNRGGRDFGSSSRPSNPPSKTLFIGNMSFEMSDKDLNDLFREVRNVVDVRVAIDRRTGQPRGFAHCDLLDIESAQKAKEILEGKEVYGRRLRVDFSASNTNRNN